ncbi:MAG: hypothetical protein E5V66_16335 [Mesorhizobium sp.]|uniref:hypothetical protein n=1 Tax=Mesorhizobium sp. TaxID=1871066 RepID=UPI00121A9AC9|nr:hypothetical protein [Mesorhizobium sp.]TIV81761.1 MAG: hypothetical protein E5V64_14870 [Mesorhizobium sp.]TIW10870.1 MAG: hypothetical protein E5V66_16335 [Mesorhizobium sp.]
MDSHTVVASLPIAGTDRTVLIDAANAAFERIIGRIEPANEQLTRTLWDAESYIDNEITADMLPISRDEAAYLVDVFLLHHLVQLAVSADREAAEIRPRT